MSESKDKRLDTFKVEKITLHVYNAVINSLFKDKLLMPLSVALTNKLKENKYNLKYQLLNKSNNVVGCLPLMTKCERSRAINVE